MTEEKYEDIGYVSLHNHTTYSILDSLIKPADLFIKAKELGQTAIAVTDHGSMAGMWDSLKASKETGVKLIPGCEFYFVNDASDQDERMRHVILLSTNEIGYKNLLELAAEGFDSFKYTFKKVFPRIDWKMLEKYSDGLICTTACANGILGQLINEKKYDEALEQAKRLQSIFGDNLAIELQAHALKRANNSYSGEIDQVATNKRLRAIAEEIGAKCIVTTNAHYCNEEQCKSHDLLLAMASGQPVDSGNRLRYENVPLHIRSEEDIYTKLARITYDKAFAKTCIENTKYFADKCEMPLWIDPKYSNPSGKELPEFPVKDQVDYQEFIKWNELNQIEGKAQDEMYLRFRCDLGLKELIPEEKHKEYNARLDEEYDVIEHHNFSSYMLIVMDYLEWSRNNDIPIGPGRGSAGSSLIGYLTKIHILDPIKYGLVFARFHNKEKKAFPDIDCDFSQAGKGRVEEYITKKYGEKYVAHVSNLNTMTPKVYARSIARAFMYGGDRKTAVQVGTAIADTIPSDIKKVDVALEKAALFAEYAKPIEDGGAGYVELQKYAKDIGGQFVAWSTHAGGLVIGKRPLRGLVPIRRDKEQNIAIEYSKDTVEENGLVKMDILGVSTLDIIKDTYQLIYNLGKPVPSYYPDFDEYDSKVYDLIASGNLFGVFQLGTSGGTIDLCKKIKPKNIEELAMINSLARPALREIRSDFIATKAGNREMVIAHKSLDRAMGATYGFPLFEESLLFLVQDLAGWNLNEADRLRKMTKSKGKDQDKVQKIKDDFINDSMNHSNVKKEFVEGLWNDVVLPFSLYGFNKSHAVAYSLLGYQTAWLKAHYPLEFLVSNLKSEVSSGAKIAKDNIAKIKEEIRQLKINIVPPDINKSDLTYSIIDSKTILTGFDAIKNMGKDAMPEILAKRPFTSFEDFLTRVDATRVRSNAIQALAASGCLDSFGKPRKLMYLYASDYKKKLQAFIKNQKKNPEKYKEFNYPWPADDEWTVSEKCALERFYIGEALSGDKVQEFNGFFTKGAPSFKNLHRLLPPPPATMTEKELKKYSKKITLLQGEVKNIFEFKVKKEDSKIRGEVMAKVTLEDPHGNQIAMTCFPDGWVNLQNRCLELSNNKHKLDTGVGLYINGNLGWYEGSLSITFDDLAKFSPAPQLPKDLKAKKVSMRKTKEETETIKSEDESDRNILLDEIEEELIEMGNADLDDDYDFDFN